MWEPREDHENSSYPHTQSTRTGPSNWTQTGHSERQRTSTDTENDSKRATRLHQVYISIEFDTNSGYLYRESKSERTTSHADHADGGAEKLTFTRNFWFNSEQNRSTW